MWCAVACFGLRNGEHFTFVSQVSIIGVKMLALSSVFLLEIPLLIHESYPLEWQVEMQVLFSVFVEGGVPLHPRHGGGLQPHV